MHRLPSSNRRLAPFVVAAALAAVLPGRGFGAPAGVPAAAAPEQAAIPLQLEIFINQAPAKVIGAFRRLPDGRIAAARSELEESGVHPPGAGAPGQIIVLDDIAGLTYRYDEPGQKIDLTITESLRAEQAYDARGADAAPQPVTGGTGAVLNYNLFTSALRSTSNPNVSFQGVSASLDGRVFSALGTVSQSAILGSTLLKPVDALRLETAWTYSDPDSLRVYKAGDTISSGLAWTRPIRMGGLQVQRNFGLRPDLVTLPLPAISGSAAVPSTVDVYVNNIKTYSQDVGTGPYRLSNLPLVSGDGTARVVLRDATGKETESSIPFFTTAKLLKPGYSDYSLEAGLPRLFFGSLSDVYSRKPVASASLRRGMFDWLTAESHAEATTGLLNGGLGGVARLANRMVLTGAAAGSYAHGAGGAQVFGGLETRMWGVSLNANTQRSFGAYEDLASVTAQTAAPRSNGTSTSSGGGDLLTSLTGIKPPKSLDRVSISVPVPYDRSAVSLSFIRLVTAAEKRSNIVTASYSRNLFWRASAYVSAFADLSDRKQKGVYAGLSAPLGATMSISAGASFGAGGANYSTDVSRPLQQEPGSYGWRLHDSEGTQSYRSAAGSYRSTYARVEAGVAQDRNSMRGTAEVEGSIATMGGGVFLANRIDDAFAVADVGAPGVDVYYENKLVGKSDRNGQILVPNLRSYQRNKISIDPRNLPVDALAPSTQDVIAPKDRSGILVKFGVNTNVQGAVLILKGRDGKDIPPGVSGSLNGGAEPVVVGYDGRAYATGLKPGNSLVMDIEGRPCTAAFPYTPQKNTQVVIGPVTCQ